MTSGEGTSHEGQESTGLTDEQVHAEADQAAEEPAVESVDTAADDAGSADSDEDTGST